MFSVRLSAPLFIDEKMNVIFIRYDWPVGVVDFHYTILTNLLHQNFICGWTLMSSTWYPHFQVKRSKSLGLVVTKHKTSHLIGIYWGTSDFDKLYVPDELYLPWYSFWVKRSWWWFTMTCVDIFNKIFKVKSTVMKCGLQPA